jgi:glycosyltransferase involved in cell wall biosynthesis
VLLIPNGVDTSLFGPDPEDRRLVRSELGWSDVERVVVTTTRLHDQKGVDHAIRGFAEYSAADPQARYLIVGGGPQEPTLRGLSGKLGLADRIVFVGDVSREVVVRFLRAGDVFLFTTLREEAGVPLNLLEAAGVGLPLVVSRSLLDVARSVSIVRGVDPRDAASVAGALASLFERGDDLERKSRLPVEFSLDHCAARYREILFPRT